MAGTLQIAFILIMRYLFGSIFSAEVSIKIIPFPNENEIINQRDRIFLFWWVRFFWALSMVWNLSFCHTFFRHCRIRMCVTNAWIDTHLCRSTKYRIFGTLTKMLSMMPNHNRPIFHRQAHMSLKHEFTTYMQCVISVGLMLLERWFLFWLNVYVCACACASAYACASACVCLCVGVGALLSSYFYKTNTTNFNKNGLKPK